MLVDGTKYPRQCRFERTTSSPSLVQFDKGCLGETDSWPMIADNSPSKVSATVEGGEGK